MLNLETVSKGLADYGASLGSVKYEFNNLGFNVFLFLFTTAASAALNPAPPPDWIAIYSRCSNLPSLFISSGFAPRVPAHPSIL